MNFTPFAVAFWLYSIGGVLDAVNAVAQNWRLKTKNANGFSSIACDQTIGQTFNRQSKTKVESLAFLSIA